MLPSRGGRYATDQKRRRGGGPCAVFCEIGNSSGSCRPGDIRDTHSVRCPHAGFGRPLFNDIPPRQSRHHGKWAPYRAQPTGGGGHLPYSGLILKLRPYPVNGPPRKRVHIYMLLVWNLFAIVLGSKWLRKIRHPYPRLGSRMGASQIGGCLVAIPPGSSGNHGPIVGN